MRLRRIVLALGIGATLIMPAVAADVTNNLTMQRRGELVVPEAAMAARVYRGRVTVMDGRTLWFPQYWP